MKCLNLLFYFLICLSFGGIDLIDDYVPPVLRITTQLTLGNTFQFEASYFNNVGELITNSPIEWESANTAILTVDTNGIVTPNATGQVQIIAKITTEDGSILQDELTLSVQSNVVLEEPEIVLPPAETETPESTLVTPTITITNGISQITALTNYQLEISYRDEMGNEVTPPPLLWESTNNEILSVDGAGNIEALTPGTATLTVSALVSTSIITSQSFIYVIEPIVAMVTSFSGELVSKSNYKLEGGFTLSEESSGLILSFDGDYEASTALPGLYLYLSNNANTTSGAYEVGAVTVFKGAHSYTLDSSFELMDYQYILFWCKPFNVKVGEAKIYD
jgi:hypothetical protein